MKYRINRVISRILAISLVLVAVGIQSHTALAASVTSLSDNMSRLKASTASNHEIKFVTPSGVQTTETVTLTFSADFTGVSAIDNTDIDFAEGDSNNCTTANFTEETLVASGATSSQWNASASGQVVTLESGGASATIATNVCVRIKIGLNATSQVSGDEQISNGAVDDDDTVAVAGTFGDTGTLAVDIITDDQVVITATVDPSITFSISDNTIEFGTLTASDDTFADDSGGNPTEVEAHQLAAGTNATSGYVMYVSGATLTSGANTINAIGGTNTASSPGSEQFGVRYTASGGSGSVLAPYAASGFAYNGVSSPDDIASASGATATTTYSARYLANIASNTEAGAYSTTFTYTATATY